MKSIAIIGSGPAGLTAAAILSDRGYKVVVYEANDTYGGKIGLLNLGRSFFDTGPSLLTEPWVIDDVYSQLGKDPKDYWQYNKIEEGTKYFWDDGTEMQISGDKNQIINKLSKSLDIDEELLQKYISKIAYQYEQVAPEFLDTQPNLLQMANPVKLAKVIKTLPFLINSANKMNTKVLKGTKAVQLFNRFATYSGSNPYIGPALLNVAGAPELLTGNYYPKGGMRSIADGLYKLTLEGGAIFKFNSAVKTINKSGGGYKIEAKNESIDFDAVIYAGDYSKLSKLLGKTSKKADKKKSTSGVVFYWEVKGSFNKLNLHNILFSNDYKTEFEYLSKGKVYKDPTVYINITSKMEPKLAKKGHENWFVMVNVPAGYKADINDIRKNVIKKVNKNIDNFNITNEDLLTPQKIEQTTGSKLGAIYGHDSNSIISAIKKPKAQVKGYANLYCVGGSVHPGGGVPLSVRSAKIIARSL